MDGGCGFTVREGNLSCWERSKETWGLCEKANATVVAKGNGSEWWRPSRRILPVVAMVVKGDCAAKS
jgi:hypothetical protein